MTGYEVGFLEVDVPLPTVAVTTERLDYVHFTVLQQPERRLAALTAVNIDGASLVDVPRSGDRWMLDDRLPASAQAGPELYASNPFDRGHLVRRRDPVWGDDAERANADTFHYTNAAPQVDLFNQGPELWLGLEDYLLNHAATYDRRLTVFTGPVLAPDDPEYRGVHIPRRFWKIAVWIQDAEVAASSYLLDQSELVADVLSRHVTPEAPPLGAYRTFQVSVADVCETAGLTAPSLLTADVYSGRPPTELRDAAAVLRTLRG